MTEIASIDWFGRWGTSVFSENTAIFTIFFDLEKAYHTTWKYGIMKNIHYIGLKGWLPFFYSEFFK